MQAQNEITSKKLPFPFAALPLTLSFILSLISLISLAVGFHDRLSTIELIRFCLPQLASAILSFVILVLLYARKVGAPLMCAFCALEAYTIYSWISGIVSAPTLMHYVDSPFCVILSLIPLAIIAYAMVIVFNIEFKKGHNKLTKICWFVPALLILISQIINTLTQYFAYHVSIGNLIPTVLSGIVSVLYLLMLGIWYKKLNDPQYEGISEENTRSVSDSDAYFSMTAHVLLLLFVGVVWQYVWIFRTTKYTNRALDFEQRNPVTKLLLCMFVPFYYLYWVYQSCKRIDSIAAKKGLSSDITAVSVICAIFVGIVTPIIMQNKLNQISAAQPVQTDRFITEHNALDALREYKQMLDEGLITVEEFEVHKAAILNK